MSPEKAEKIPRPTVTINRTERIIKDYHIRVGVCCSRQCYSRTLSSAQIDTAFYDVLTDMSGPKGQPP